MATPTLFFDYNPKTCKASISGDNFLFDKVRQQFSVENTESRFTKSKYKVERKYVITPTGQFSIGLFYDIRRFMKNLNIDHKIVKSDAFNAAVNPKINVSEIAKLDWEYRDHQSNIIRDALAIGRGVSVLGTSGGKTLACAGLIQTLLNKNPSLKIMMLCPLKSLIVQALDDFAKYGVKFTYSGWSGDHELYKNRSVVIATTDIVQSKVSRNERYKKQQQGHKSEKGKKPVKLKPDDDIKWFDDVDILICDEVHVVKKGNEVDRIIDKYFKVYNRFGFTGTLPEDKYDEWNVIGKIGPVLYVKGTDVLREEGHVTPVKVRVFKLIHKKKPFLIDPDKRKKLSPTEMYRAELDFIINNKFRNELILDLCSMLTKNTLITVDRIEHGRVLEELLKSGCPDKNVYFINGDVSVNDREQVKRLMEREDNIIAIAITKIFSTGISINNLHHVITAGGGKAKVRLIQLIGRTLRLHDSKKRAYIFDIADMLHYGTKHLQKRIEIYNSEKIPYDIKRVVE